MGLLSFLSPINNVKAVNLTNSMA